MPPVTANTLGTLGFSHSNSGFAGSLAYAGLFNVKGEHMSSVRVVQLLGLVAVLVVAAMPSPADAACACSGVGQSNGHYAAPSPYGSYGNGASYGPQQPQVQTAQPKAKKSKKKSSQSKPAAQ